MGWLDWILDPLAYGFMWRGLLAALMVGVLCSVLGTYVILQGMAFFGDALAPALLPCVFIASLSPCPLALGSLVFGVITPVAISAPPPPLPIRPYTPRPP
ncbi:hypothetical protein RY27_06395, partial [Litorilinea aerophila]